MSVYVKDKKFDFDGGDLCGTIVYDGNFYFKFQFFEDKTKQFYPQKVKKQSTLAFNVLKGFNVCDNSVMSCMGKHGTWIQNINSKSLIEVKKDDLIYFDKSWQKKPSNIVAKVIECGKDSVSFYLWDKHFWKVIIEQKKGNIEKPVLESLERFLKKWHTVSLDEISLFDDKKYILKTGDTLVLHNKWIIGEPKFAYVFVFKKVSLRGTKKYIQGSIIAPCKTVLKEVDIEL